MTLESRHFAILSAVRDTIAADADLATYNPTIRKKAYNRGLRWEPGIWVVPAGRTDPNHENTVDETIFRVAVVFCEPKDQDLTDGLEVNLAVSERLMAIFKNKAHGAASVPLQDLTTALAGEDGMVFQRATCEQGPQFPDDPFNAGYDVSAITVSVAVTYLRRDTSTLGAAAP